MYQAVRELITQRYSAVHGARVASDFPNYCTVTDQDGPRAVLGFRKAEADELFLERYLDTSVEIAVQKAFGFAIPRERIVELGAHASSRPHATIALWAQAAETLHGQCDVAVAVLTAPLRSMFARLRLPIMEIAAADRERLGNQSAEWGSYYNLAPIVCAGLISSARAPLARWQAGRE